MAGARSDGPNAGKRCAVERRSLSIYPVVRDFVKLTLDRLVHLGNEHGTGGPDDVDDLLVWMVAALGRARRRRQPLASTEIADRRRSCPWSRGAEATTSVPAPSFRSGRRTPWRRRDERVRRSPVPSHARPVPPPHASKLGLDHNRGRSGPLPGGIPRMLAVEILGWPRAQAQRRPVEVLLRDGLVAVDNLRTKGRILERLGQDIGVSSSSSGFSLVAVLMAFA